MSPDMMDKLRGAAARPSGEPNVRATIVGGKRPRPSRRLTIGAGAACIAAAGLFVLNMSPGTPSQNPPASSPPQPVHPATNGAIGFLRVDPEEMLAEGALPHADIYVIQPQERRAKLLLREAGYRSRPAWSPDGSRIAFVGDGGLFVANSQGGDITKLTDCRSVVCTGPPTWSPDGSRIAFGGPDGDGDGLWSLDIATRELSLVLDGVTVIGAPSWSPDGQRIAVIKEVRSGGKLEKRLVSISVSDGSLSVLNSDQDIALGEAVAWSPDGESLVFDSFEDDTEGGGIYLMEVESGETRLVTSCSPPTECIDIYPAWSPDGSQILFTRGRCDQLGSDCFMGDLFAVEIGEVRPRRITSGSSLDCCATWQPLRSKGD